jgi:hypothetical protein
MKKRKSTNWSSVARRALEEEMRKKEMSAAAEGINRLRSSARTPGWSGAKEIRKRRDAAKSEHLRRIKNGSVKRNEHPRH